MNTQLSLCMIVKNNDPSEVENLPRLFRSVDNYVDEICVTVTHAKGESPTEFASFLKDKGVQKLSTFEWVNDFAAARNFSFKQASHELVLWLDADDVMIKGEEIPSLVKRFEDSSKLTSVWINYAYERDEDDNVVMWVPRERIVRKSIHRWVGKLHENLIAQYLPIVDIIDKDICYINHNCKPEDVAEKATRNLTVIENAYREEVKNDAVDPRTVYDLGRSYHALRLFEQSKNAFIEFLGINDDTSSAYDTYCRLADIAKANGNLNESKDYAMQAVKIKHAWPAAYQALAYVAFIEEKWAECIHWLKVADKLEFPKGVLPHDPTKYEIRPLSLAQECYFRMNKPQEALLCAKRALSLAPSSEPLQQAVKMIEQFLHDQEVELSYVTVLGELKQTKEEKKVKNILDCVPNSMADHPFIVHMRNEYNKKDTSNRIVFYCHESFERWSPKSVATGVGGSEEAVINVSKNLAKLGWAVDVYCDCDAPGEYDGVNWCNYYEYDRHVDCKVFVAWRMNEFILLAPPKSLKVLWMHDKQRLDYFREDIISKTDKIFALSEYHRKDLPDIPDDKFYITRNGIDSSQFIDSDRDLNKYIYASSPDRGLHKVLESWPKIKEINPKAELHVFYGFNKVYDKIQEEDTRRAEFKERIMSLVETLPDIHWHGRVGHQELADWFMKCGFWLYPCTFDEISCITAMKAQAAGCWPVTNDFAALAETVVHGTVTKGSVENPDVLGEWVESVGRAIEEATPERRASMREWALNFFSWETLSKDWSTRFNEWVSEKSKKSVVAS